jgi:glycosyltransferase involved in cell wall biosynthesis
MKTISAIVPTYKDGARLTLALESIATQTYPHAKLEIIVVDDGSNDDTAQRVAAFAATSPVSTFYFVQANAGPAAARNHGIRMARGDVVAFLDADDRWQPTKLERQIPLLRERVALVYCDNIFVDAEGLAIENYVRTIPMHHGDILLPLFCNLFLLTSAVVVPRMVLNEVGGFDEGLPVGEDYEFFLRLAQCYNADCIDQKLLVRCVRPDSASRLDYAIDARIDLATLSRFLQANPRFARANQRVVDARIARYRYDFGWRLLADGHRREAIAQLLQSLRASVSLPAARTLLRALLPVMARASG